LVLLRSGFARVSQSHGAGHRTSAYLGKGHLFGLEELTHNALRPTTAPPVPFQHSLRAVGFLDTLQIPAATFADEILPYVRQSELPPPIRLDTAAEQAARGGNRSEPVEDVPTGLLEFIMQHRLNNGREAMVIDLHRCTRCDDCVTACAATHGGNPRFARTGPEHDRLQFAQACMHCTDPVCMIGCPTGAIARDPQTGTVSIHEPICVGCGTCANACPYQNIQMTEIRDREGRLFRDATSELPILKATKCDLCQTEPSGPACLQSCPHDALERVDLGDVTSLADYLQRRGIETP
jgi:Fe-S-cluster-containing dehydrogenase component